MNPDSITEKLAGKLFDRLMEGGPLKGKLKGEQRNDVFDQIKQGLEEHLIMIGVSASFHPDEFLGHTEDSVEKKIQREIRERCEMAATSIFESDTVSLHLESEDDWTKYQTYTRLAVLVRLGKLAAQMKDTKDDSQ